MPRLRSWYREVRAKLEASGIFTKVEVIGAKIRGWITGELYLDIYYDPSSGSYSYALIDRALESPGDKRLFGWDDYPHEGVAELRQLRSYPHHFQRRGEGGWVFEESPMRGDVRLEIELVIQRVRSYLGHER